MASPYLVIAVNDTAVDAPAAFTAWMLKVYFVLLFSPVTVCVIAVANGSVTAKVFRPAPVAPATVDATLTA